MTRSHWWITRDVRRLIARAEFTNGGPITVAELRYLRAHADLLLRGPLPLADAHLRESVERVQCDVLAALAAERIGGGA